MGQADLELACGGQAGLELAQEGKADLRLAILLLQPLQGRDYSVHHAQLDPDF